MSIATDADASARRGVAALAVAGWALRPRTGVLMLSRRTAATDGGTTGLDDLVTDVTGGSGGGGSAKMLGQVTRLVDQAGGVDGLVSKLQSSGLGGKARSWVGKGDNEPVSGDELRNALGDDELRKAGVDPDQDAGGSPTCSPRWSTA